MLAMLTEWYQRRFTDPQAVALLAILLAGFGIIYFMSGILAPLLVAIVIAYLLEWPTARLERIGLSRTWAASLVLIIFIGLALLLGLVVVPTAWQQGINLLADMPNMINRFYGFTANLAQSYPALFDAGIVDMMTENLRTRLSALGPSVVKYSLASLVSLVTLAIYMILVPLMVFFLLKDKVRILNAVRNMLPREHGLAGKVWQEMNQQITNYIRGKVLEMVVVWIVSYLAFFVLDLRYALLLSVLVGISVLIPYIGTVIVTIPVVMVALFQWGVGPDFWTLVVAYLVIQALDGNVLSTFLYSEAVNMHPLVIILAIVLFGGLWGFWGLFFAIPLATLVKAVVHAWPDNGKPQG